MKKIISKDLLPYFKLSLGFHIAIFLFFGVKVLIFSDFDDLDNEGTIKVDMVALPNKDDNKKFPEPKKDKPKEEKKEEPEVVKEEKKPEPKEIETKIPEPKIVEKKPVIDPKSESDALAKLKEMEALKKIAESVTKNEPESNSEEIKGNRIAVGDSITGLNRIHYTNYKKVLHDAIKKNWNLPTWIQDGNLNAEILVKIDVSGHITFKELTLSSGNTMYDKYVLQAVAEASPFPAPPDKFVNIVGYKGVVLRFP